MVVASRYFTADVNIC